MAHESDAASPSPRHLAPRTAARWQRRGFSLEDVHATLPVRLAAAPRLGNGADGWSEEGRGEGGGGGRRGEGGGVVVGGVRIGGSPRASPCGGLSCGGLLGAIAAGEGEPLDSLATQFGERGWVAVRLGIGADVWRQVLAAGKELTDRLTPTTLAIPLALSFAAAPPAPDSSPRGVRRGAARLPAHEAGRARRRQRRARKQRRVPLGSGAGRPVHLLA